VLGYGNTIAWAWQFKQPGDMFFPAAHVKLERLIKVAVKQIAVP
jgi:hypothetical protein